MQYFIWIILPLAVALTITACNGAENSGIEYLADMQERFLFVRQDWGELGINGCAHMGDAKSIPLQIGKKEYAKGLGHHANGEILIDLNGEYAKFEAEVGVQAIAGSSGSVIFKVLVDGKEKFNSGVMKHDEEAKPLSIALDGAYDLELIATDSGDGISYDCADWAEARLTRGTAKAAGTLAPYIDIAPFGSIVASDPSRMDGVRAGRTEEFHKEDIYLEIPVKRDAEGNYLTFITKEGKECIGISWLEKRYIRELSLMFSDGTAPKNTDGVQLQYWSGGTPHQGKWTPLVGTVEAQKDKWIFNNDRKNNTELLKGTWKIRWILPRYEQHPKIRNLSATSCARYYPVDFRIEIELVRKYDMRIYNGEIIKDSIVKDSKLTVRCTRSRAWQAENTTLLFNFADGAFGVSLNDVLNQDAVYVKDFGVFVAKAEANLTLADYKKKIADKKTILQKVREMPDQTFEQALKAVHNPNQDVQPMLLSLSCDNRKFIVERNGTISFSSEYEKANEFVSSFQPLSCRMIPQFGSGKNDKLTRHLDGGWLPAPVTEVRENGVLYRQRTFVAPSLDLLVTDVPIGAAKDVFPVCVAQYTMRNEKDESVDMSLALTFLTDAGKNETATIVREGSSPTIKITKGVQLIALTDTKNAPMLTTVSDNGKISLKGSLKAGEVVECVVYIPTWHWKGDGQLAVGSLYENMRDHWQEILSDAAQIEIPDLLLKNVIRASQVQCLIASRNEDGRKRIAPWIASVAYGPLESESNSIIRGMDLLGYKDFSQKSLDYFIERYSPSGLLTTGYTLMGMGWHLQTLGEHYALTQDKEWLKRNAEKVMTACNWVVKQREKTKDTPDGIEMPQRGLMPPGVMADWNAYAYYFCLNGYFCAGLRNASQALMDINQPGADKLFAESEEFSKDILRAYHYTQSLMPVYALRDGTSVPAYPSALERPGPTNSFYPGEDGNRSWAYDVEVGGHHLVPQGILDPKSKDVDWMMNHMEDVQFLAEGWFDYSAEKNQKDWYNLGGFSKVQPYYTRAGEIYAMRDDVKPFIRAYFNTLPSLLNLETLSLQEHFNGAGAWNKTHETGYFLQQTRFMLVMEHGDELYLAPLITSNWLKDGCVVAITNAPTRFGTLSYRITSSVDKGFIEALIDSPTRNQLKQLVLRLRHPEGKQMKSVTVNGKDYKDFDPKAEIIRLKPSSERMTIRVNYSLN
jgi:hypothetical protein